MKAVQPLAVLREFVGKYPTQAEAAAALGIAPTYLSGFLRGRRKINDGLLKKIGLKRIVVRSSRRA